MPSLKMLRMREMNMSGVLILIVASFLPAAVSGQIARQKINCGTMVGQFQVARVSKSGVPLLLLAAPATNRPLMKSATVRSSFEIENIASRSLQTVVPLLGFSPAATFHANATIKVANSWQTTYALSYAGIPVRDRFLHVVVGAASGQPMTITNDLPVGIPVDTTPVISSDDVLSGIPNYLGDDKTNPFSVRETPNLIFFCGKSDNELKLSYEMTVVQNNPLHVWRLRIDAISGELLEKREMLDFIGGETRAQATLSGTLSAKVHAHSPYDTLSTVGLPYTRLTVNGVTVTTDSLGYWSIQSTLPVLSVSADLSSLYSSTFRQDGANAVIANLPLQSPYTLLWNDANSNAAERDAYYSVSLARAYVRRIDPDLTKLDSELAINVNLPETCNAFYDPGTVSLNFFASGGQCSNTGEIADVVYHEFGHRVTHARYEMAGVGDIQNESLGEGFADVTSAFIRDNPTIGNGFYSTSRTTLLRNCDNTLSYPKDLSTDPHATGSIVAGAFWDLRKLIGHDTAEKLFHMSGYLAPDGPDDTSPESMQSAFLNTLIAVLTVDDDNNDLTDGTPHSAAILEAFAKHNITFAGFISLNVEKIGDQDSTVQSYPVHVTASYTGLLGALDPNSLMLYYSTNKGKTFASTPLTLVHDSLFVAQIPHFAPGTIVRYYANASTTLENAGSLSAPLPTDAYAFMIGFTRVSLDSCETENGWSTSIASDAATTGLWTLAKPFGTYVYPDQYVQQDTDHSSEGTMCYVTGNMASTNIGADDVDKGATTLTTPRLDLSQISSPVIRYYYYFSNDQGANPGLPPWIVKISNDDGTTWKTIQTTTAATAGWTNMFVRVSDYLPPSANVRLRFIASDNYGSIVEAGVDDLEILTAPASSIEAVSSAGSSSLALGAVYPNPFYRSNSHSLSIPFTVAVPSHVTLLVKNVLGDNVATLVDQKLEAGSFNVSLPVTSNLSAGVYWVVLESADARLIRKVVIGE